MARERRPRAEAPPAAPAPQRRPKRYRITVFGEPRSPWRDSVKRAYADAIELGLASYDEERDEHYLAVPVDLQSEDIC